MQIKKEKGAWFSPANREVMLQISILLIYIKLLQRHSLISVTALGAVSHRLNRDKPEWACYSECNTINFTLVHSMVCACIRSGWMMLRSGRCDLRLLYQMSPHCKLHYSLICFSSKVLQGETRRQSRKSWFFILFNYFLHFYNVEKFFSIKPRLLR